MGIWIRSQNSNILVESTRLNIEEEIENSIENINLYEKPTGNFEINGVRETLGVYSSKERALEVLDAIQSHIIGARENQNNPPGVDTSYWNSVFAVYQMPKE